MEYNFLLVVCNALMLVGAGIVFILPLRKRRHWMWWFPVLFVLSIIPMDMGYRSNDDGMVVLFHVLTYLVLLLMVNRCTMLPFMDICYCAIWIMITAETVQELWFILRLQWVEFRVMDLQGCAGLLVFAAVIFVILSRTMAKWLPQGDLYQVGTGQLICAILGGGMFVALAYLFLLPQSGRTEERAILGLCQIYCVTLLCLHSESSKRRTAEHKLDILNLLCSFGAQQYTIAYQNITIVNQKCAELEEKIRQMREYLPEEFRQESGDLIQDAQRCCDTLVKSGNEVLDIVLTEKSLLAETNATRISCVADGKLLDFMETVDLYALFSYGLETALEDVARIPDESHRLIDLVVHECQNFAVIHMYHPVKDSADGEGGRDGTMRLRNKLNSYKILVIHRIVEKYHGIHTVESKDGFCSLKILFPLSANKK